MGRERDAPLVHGEIIISAAVAPFRGATAHVRLEDVSFADAAAIAIAETAIPGVDHDPAVSGETIVPFALRAGQTAPTIEGRNEYAVRAWIDRDSDGTPGPDDLYSDRRYAVLTYGYGRVVTIRLDAR